MTNPRDFRRIFYDKFRLRHSTLCSRYNIYLRYRVHLSKGNLVTKNQNNKTNDTFHSRYIIIKML
ncbi:hypothetical protein CFV354_1147 [Campylobacter fetus subsp. venerealis NCTC 10354]|nr:hypothetical protein CFV354_1147 [Campylobacter fetus subsp. venerealis NCTC 10354]